MDEELDKSSNVRVNERDSGRFSRSVVLPKGCKTEDMQAKVGE
jgi:HSP20 family molecular chaperone IbpA